MAAGLYLIVVKRNAFRPVCTPSDPKAEPTKPKEEKTSKVELVRKVPLEKLVLPDGFPSQITIYFGTQTGTAEKFALTLESEANSIFENGLSSTSKQVRALDMEEFNGETFRDTYRN